MFKGKCTNCGVEIVLRDQRGRYSVPTAQHSQCTVIFRKTESGKKLVAKMVDGVEINELEDEIITRETRQRIPCCKGCRNNFDYTNVVRDFGDQHSIKDLTENGFEPVGVEA